VAAPIIFIGGAVAQGVWEMKVPVGGPMDQVPHRSWISLQIFFTDFDCRNNQTFKILQKITSWFLTSMFHGGGCS